jgi:hypothetical protein
MHDLGTLGGGDLKALALTSTTSVGLWVTRLGLMHRLAALVFDGVTIHDLNQLIVGKNPFSQLIVAHGINNSGDIVGVGFVNGRQHFYLATHRSRPLSRH